MTISVQKFNLIFSVNGIRFTKFICVNLLDLIEKTSFRNEK